MRFFRLCNCIQLITRLTGMVMTCRNSVENIIEIPPKHKVQFVVFVVLVNVLNVFYLLKQCK